MTRFRVLVGLLISSASSVTAFAKAPFVSATPPASVRRHVGKFEVIALSDGTADLPMSKLLSHITPAQFKAALAEEMMTEPFETSVNAFLINTGDKLILVDSGAGALFGPTVGRMLGNLKASGFRPEDVDVILISHMHPDHVGGLTSGGQAVFPKAIVYADPAESAYWLSEANKAKAPADKKGFFEGAQAALAPYQKLGRLQPFPKGDLAPGLRAEARHGHTPGHAIFRLESEGQKLALIGDLVHVRAVQFANPSVVIGFDSDSREAEAERRAVFTEAAKDGFMIAASHLPFPGWGHVKKAGKGFRFMPAEYTR